MDQGKVHLRLSLKKAQTETKFEDASVETSRIQDEGHKRTTAASLGDPIKPAPVKKRLDLKPVNVVKKEKSSFSRQMCPWFKPPEAISPNSTYAYNSTTIFIVQAFVAGAILCIPGNLTTFILMATMKERSDNQTTPAPVLNITNTNESANSSCHELKSEYKDAVVAARFWIEGVGIFVIGIIGLAGNLLTIVTLSLIKTNKNFNKLLISLAIVDSLLIFELMLEMSIVGSFVQSVPVWFHLIYPYLLHPGRGIIQTADIFMMVAVSAERYKAICQPLVPRQPYYMYLTFVAVTSFCLEFPRFFEFKLNQNRTDYITTDLMENTDYIMMNSYWNELFVCGIVPFIAMAYMNLMIHKKIRASSRFTKRFIGSGRRAATKNFSEVCDDEILTESKTWRQSSKKTGTSVKSENRRANSVPQRLELIQEHNVEGLRGKQQSSPVDENSPAESAGSKEPEIEMQLLPIKSPTPQDRNINSRSTLVPHTSRTQIVKKRREKSTIILVSVVLVFIVCHTYRLAFRTFELAFPESAILEHYHLCNMAGRYHVPVILYLLANLHYLFLTANSSINFIIYCIVGQEFRKHLKKIFS